MRAQEAQSVVFNNRVPNQKNSRSTARCHWGSQWNLGSSEPPMMGLSFLRQAMQPVRTFF